MQEIERKFLLKNQNWLNDVNYVRRIEQGYLSTNPAVRIRIKGDEGFITIKGEGNASGVSRFEWEKKIHLEEAEQLMELCDPSQIIRKRRYVVITETHLIEIDEFQDKNWGLVVAEIELKSEDEEYPKPDWLGEEVTGKPEYYNSALTKNPYKNWK